MKKAVYLAVLLGCFLNIQQGWAATARELEVSVDVALDRFKEDMPGGAELLKNSKGVLVFPGVWKVGFGLGGEYGEGALRVKGKTVDFYRTAGGSFGFQLGAQVRRFYVLFLDDRTLQAFQANPDWRGIANASAVLGPWGAEGSIDTMSHNEPMLVYVIDQKGVMYNANLEAAKFSKIKK